MALQSLDIKRRSASSTSPPSIRQGIEVTKLIDVSACIGCKACQVACSEWNDIRDDVGNNIGVYDNPSDLTANSWTVMRFNEVEENGKLQWLIRKDGCMHCENPGCLKACPSPGAIIQYTNGIVDFHQENCIGCGYCITACPFDIPRLSKKDDKAYKCTLCSDRVAVGQEPACVKTCPTGAIRFGSQEDMTHLAAERVGALKKRGFEHAGIYPPRPGQTHVLYVLHHADRPELYNDLGTKSRAKPIIDLWKGFLKPLATFGIAGSILFGFFHYITVGPYDADRDDKDRELIDPDDHTSNDVVDVTEKKEENV